MLQQANAKLRKKFDPSLPIEVLFACMDKVQDLATASDNVYTYALLSALHFTSSSHLVYIQTHAKNGFNSQELYQMWKNFKPHFTQAYCLLHEMQMSAAQAGYTANNVFADQEINKTAEAIAQLEAATQSDWTTVANLTAANSMLMEQ
eukprot:13034099-Ditylum_brightwellii.AAC.1